MSYPQFLVVRIGGLLLFLLFLFGVIESETRPWKVFFLILTVALLVAAVRLYKSLDRWPSDR